MIAVEHSSKHLEVVALPDKEAGTTSAAFAAARYWEGMGARPRCSPDQGSEWEGQFQQMLVGLHGEITGAPQLITRRADGLAERCVGTIKRA
jgi:hypothetical protein